MKTIFENNGGSYKQQGNYLLPNLTLSDGIEKQIGVWGIRHKRYLKSNHRLLYYNLLTSSKLDNYLADVEERAKNLFEQTVKSLAEQEQVTEKLNAENMMFWVQKMNNIRNRATEIVNEQVIYRWEKGITNGENFRRLCLNFICEIRLYNLSEQTIWLSKR